MRSLGSVIPMAATTIVPSLIELDADGVAWISGANTKVIEVAMDVMAHGWSAEEIVFQHPHLSLAMVHAALAHYFAHKVEFDAQMEKSRKRADELRKASLENSPLRKRLRDQGALRNSQ